MTEAIYLTTREVAERLDVHARTVRNWIDTFEDYILPDLNDRGHYMLNEASIQRIQDVKTRLQEPNKTLKKVREELSTEGLIPTKPSIAKAKEVTQQESKTEKTMQQAMQSIERVNQRVEELFHRMDRFEDQMFNLFESMEDLEHKIASFRYDTLAPSDVHQMFDELRKKQDQLKIELRSAQFTQRLSASMQEQSFVPRRERKGRFFNLF